VTNVPFTERYLLHQDPADIKNTCIYLIVLVKLYLTFSCWIEILLPTLFLFFSSNIQHKNDVRSLPVGNARYRGPPLRSQSVVKLEGTCLLPDDRCSSSEANQRRSQPILLGSPQQMQAK
jgi:hypothetical protein